MVARRVGGRNSETITDTIRMPATATSAAMVGILKTSARHIFAPTKIKTAASP